MELTKQSQSIRIQKQSPSHRPHIYISAVVSSRDLVKQTALSRALSPLKGKVQNRYYPTFA